MATCCFCLSLRTGCLIAVAFYYIVALLKIIFLICWTIPEGAATIIVMNLITLILAGTLLLVGVLKSDRICIITFICFHVLAMVIQILGLLIQYTAFTDERIEAWVLSIVAAEQIPFIYMVYIGVLEFHEVKEIHMRLEEGYSSTRDIRRSISRRRHSFSSSVTVVPGLMA